MLTTIDTIRERVADALNQGQLQQALTLQATLCDLCPEDAEAHHRLGVLEEETGTLLGATRAHLRCLTLAPTVPKGYLYAGYCLQRLGHIDAAAALYSLGADLDEGVLTLWRSEQHSAPARQRSAAANDTLRSHLSALHRDAVGAAATCRRVSEAIWTRTHDQAYQFSCDEQRPQLFYLPSLSARPFEDPRHWEWALQLQRASATIAQELHNALPRIRNEGRPYLPSGTQAGSAFTELVGSLNWTALDLFIDGHANTALTPFFPETLAALAQAPLYGLEERPFEVFFSLLRPGQHIKPHYGLSNHSLTVHLPLVIPKESWLRVGGEKRRWKQGELTVFDDTFLHEACNESEDERIVLIFSIWHPELSEAERDAIRRSFRARQRWLAMRRLPNADDLR